ncbi:NTP transferase domain-containing protein [Algoriphagus aestuariicola]|jgi:NDP-sugar pyrophosphorylase family protein|uniref:NTP transferase domain-containing protein n=1 Tax=Algoriphagus aestuariicola TaxID=1852016 RepID=A0ABS3BKU6_9BACT|nr:sugar phosphate nucleotidyltransferase [Algoriphagus aestuariicola]MBN7799933.1 NTP transferase domain-containing protein [Algoriphagus aestuariicola]
MGTIQHALIMAAGRGTRMFPLTQVIPKPMAPLWGSTLIAHGIEKLLPHIPNLHITVGYKGAELAKHVIELGVHSVFNTEGKGNAWWIFNTLMNRLDEPVLVLTSDNVTDLNIDMIFAEYVRLGSPACMVVPVEPIEGLVGDFIHQHHNMVEKLDRNDPAPTYCSGIQVINPSKVNQIVDAVEDFGDLWFQLIGQKQLFSSSVLPDKWFTVDTLEQLSKMNDSKV